MDLTGIGVLLIGVACLLLAIFFAKVLNNFAKVIDGVDQTVQKLPGQLDDILNETGNLLHYSNDTLNDVNGKLGELTPLFQIVGDVGQSTRNLSSSLVDVTASVKKKMDDSAEDVPTQNKRLGGVYGTAALSYYVLQKRRELKKGTHKNSKSKLYNAGEIRALEIEQMKHTVVE